MPGCHPRRKPLLRLMHQKVQKQFAEDKPSKTMDYYMDYWTMQCGLRRKSLAQMVFSLCDGKLEMGTKTTVSSKSSIMEVASWFRTAWMLPALRKFRFMKGNLNSSMNCDILKQRMTPFLQEGYSKGLAKMFPDLNLLKHPWGILKWNCEVYLLLLIAYVDMNGCLLR